MSKVHIQSKLLSRTPVIVSRPQVLSGTGSKKKRGGGGDRLHWQVQRSTNSPTGIGSWRRDYHFTELLLIKGGRGDGCQSQWTAWCLVTGGLSCVTL